MIVPPPPPLLDAEPEDDEEVDAGAAEDEVVLLPLEPPHAATPTVRATAASNRAEILGTCVPLVGEPVSGLQEPVSG
jgi:hypothetical protein